MACILACAAARSPEGMSATIESAVERASLGAVWWASIVLTSLPFVVGGALAAGAARRIPRLRGFGAPLAAMFSPGCDCSLAGFATALARTPPAVAGFAITWGAAAGPSALLATHAAAGDRMLVARLAGAFVTAALTGLTWGAGRRGRAVHACGSHDPFPPLADRVCAAMRGLGMSALGATILLVAVPGALGALTTPFAAALAAALLSPCSTADPILARVLVHDRAAQAAFMIAAQSIDARQLSMLWRVFGWRRTLLAALAGCAGCAVAAMAAR